MATGSTPDRKEENGHAAVALLATAPHRLLFFIGAVNVLLATVWWLYWLANARWHFIQAPQPPFYAGWVHAFIMQYQLFPPFFFGFLLTVFPRWMGLPDFTRWHYVPVGLGLLGGQIATLAGAVSGLQAWIHIGVFMTAAGWLTGLCLLGAKLREVRRNAKGPTWHAWSCFAAMVFGFAGVLAAIVFLNVEDGRWMSASIKSGTYLLLVPVYFTVAHRMFPFFANNVVPGYAPWRPMYLLAALWVSMPVICAVKILNVATVVWVFELAFACIAAVALLRWWPRKKAPGLLHVLFIALTWLPVSFALMGAQDLSALLNPTSGTLGRGPLHGLFIGCFGGLLVAMVTRVTQGHSGRMLDMPGVAWFAFVLIQITAAVRVFGDSLQDPMAGFALTALLWIVAFVPWVFRSALIYLRPRVDGKPG